MHGTIDSIESQGTIIQVWVKTADRGLQPVNFDHRMFWHMVESRGAEDLIGEAVEFDDSGPEPVLRFDDEVA